MLGFRFLALGPWPIERITVTRVASTIAIPPDVAAAIDAAWLAAARPGVHLFDGPLVRLEKFQPEDAGLRLSVSATSYKHFIGTNGKNPDFSEFFGAAVMANPLGTSAALRTVDGQLVFGIRAPRMALYPGYAHPFGGGLEPGDPVDPTRETLRELQEECGLNGDDITQLSALALGEDHALRQPELVYGARLRLTLNELSTRIDPAEHQGVWTVADDADAVVQALLSTPKEHVANLTPVTRMTLLAWGRTAYGHAWFEQTHARLLGGAGSGHVASVF